MAITEKDLEAYLTGLGLSLDCTACGQSLLHLIGDSKGQKPVLMVFDPGAMTLDNLRPYEVIVLTCQDCGHIRLFDRAIVETGISGPARSSAR